MGDARLAIGLENPVAAVYWRRTGRGAWRKHVWGHRYVRRVRRARPSIRVSSGGVLLAVDRQARLAGRALLLHVGVGSVPGGTHEQLLLGGRQAQWRRCLDRAKARALKLALQVIRDPLLVDLDLLGASQPRGRPCTICQCAGLGEITIKVEQDVWRESHTIPGGTIATNDVGE